jgi:hypothetical protein
MNPPISWLLIGYLKMFPKKRQKKKILANVSDKKFKVINVLWFILVEHWMRSENKIFCWTTSSHNGHFSFVLELINYQIPAILRLKTLILHTNSFERERELFRKLLALSRARKHTPICIDVKKYLLPMQWCKIFCGLAKMSQTSLKGLIGVHLYCSWMYFFSISVTKAEFKLWPPWKS